jgi:hypothetical protein
MERELDRRLLPLKRVDPAAFRREMALQKAFNEALRQTCDDVMVGEPSTGDFRGAFRCATFLIELRTRQVEAVHAGGLEEAQPPAAAVKKARRFRGFAARLCAETALWKGAPPASCEERVLSSLDAALEAATKF